MAVVIAAAGAGGCADESSTELTIEVANGFGHRAYRFTCDPASGEVPDPEQLCKLLEANADVMLFPPETNSLCIGGFVTVHLRARGRFHGREVDATGIDACRQNAEAERLWLSQLSPPPPD
jgi:hypothetical protein